MTIAIGAATASAIVRSDGSFAAAVDIRALGASSSPYPIAYDYAGDANFQPALDASTTLTVNRATPVITWANPATITYGTPLWADQLDASASVPGSFSYSPAAATVLAAGGDQTLTVDFTPTDTTDYTTATATVRIDVAPAVTRFVGLSASQTITYGQAAVFVSGTLASGSAVPRGQAVTIAIGAATASAAVLADGSFAATVDIRALGASPSPLLVRYSYPGDANFQPALDASTTLTVSRATPVITWANPATITYGTPLWGPTSSTPRPPCPAASATRPPRGPSWPRAATRRSRSTSPPPTRPTTPRPRPRCGSTSRRRVTRFVGLSASQSITYGQAAVLVSGTLAAGSAVPRGQTVTIAIGAATASAAVHGRRLVRRDDRHPRLARLGDTLPDRLRLCR